MPRDLFLVMRRNQPDEVLAGSFLTVTLQLGVPLRPILPGAEWATVDGDLSLIRYVPAEVAR